MGLSVKKKNKKNTGPSDDLNGFFFFSFPAVIFQFNPEEKQQPGDKHRKMRGQQMFCHLFYPSHPQQVGKLFLM